MSRDSHGFSLYMRPSTVPKGRSPRGAAPPAPHRIHFWNRNSASLAYTCLFSALHRRWGVGFCIRSSFSCSVGNVEMGEMLELCVEGAEHTRRESAARAWPAAEGNGQVSPADVLASALAHTCRAGCARRGVEEIPDRAQRLLPLPFLTFLFLPSVTPLKASLVPRQRPPHWPLVPRGPAY